MFIGSLHRFFCESIGGLFAFDLTGRKTSARKLRNLEKHVEEDILHFLLEAWFLFVYTKSWYGNRMFKKKKNQHQNLRACLPNLYRVTVCSLLACHRATTVHGRTQKCHTVPLSVASEGIRLKSATAHKIWWWVCQGIECESLDMRESI